MEETYYIRKVGGGGGSGKAPKKKKARVGLFPMFCHEDIQDATHTPKREGQHLSLTFGTVLGGNVHQWHICNKCVADGLYA